MNIIGKKVILRAMEKSDLELARQMINDNEMEHLVIGWSFPLSSYQQEKWFEAHYGEKNNFRFVIELQNGESVGIVTLHDVDWKNRRASTGIKIMASRNRGQGIGTDALMAILRYVFDELQLKRIDTTWFVDNLPSKALHIKCGFTEEGMRRKYIYQGGEYKDIIFAGILAEDYYSLVQKNQYWVVT